MLLHIFIFSRCSWTWKKEEIPCFCNYLFSFLFNIDNALLLSLYDRMKKSIGDY